MDEQDFLNRIAQSMKESEQQINQSIGRPSSRATREQALRQVAMLEAEVARNNCVQEEIKTDEYGRILLTEKMKNSLHNAERSLEEGKCMNKEMFRQRFAKWL